MIVGTEQQVRRAVLTAESGVESLKQKSHGNGRKASRWRDWIGQLDK